MIINIKFVIIWYIYNKLLLHQDCIKLYNIIDNDSKNKNKFLIWKEEVE